MRYIFLALLLIAAPAHADIDTWFGQTLAAGGDEAGCVAGTTFSYNGDHSTDADTACDSDGNALDGTVNNAAASTSYVEYDATNEYVKWTIDSSEADMSATGTGTVCFTAHTVSAATHDDFLQIYYDSSNVLYIYTSGSYIYAKWLANSKTGSVDTYGFTADTDHRICYSWDVANNNTALSRVAPVGAVSWGTTDEDDIDGFSSDASTVAVGEDNSQFINVVETCRVKDVTITGGFKDADPMNN
jgi:hypothetical protein